MQEFAAEKMTSYTDTDVCLGYKYQHLMKSFHKFYNSPLRRVKEVWNSADGATIFDLKRSPCRAYPFEFYFNLFLMCAWLSFYFLSLFNVLFVAHAFSYFLFARVVFS